MSVVVVKHVITFCVCLWHDALRANVKLLRISLLFAWLVQKIALLQILEIHQNDCKSLTPTAQASFVLRQGEVFGKSGGQGRYSLQAAAKATFIILNICLCKLCLDNFPERLQKDKLEKAVTILTRVDIDEFDLAPITFTLMEQVFWDEKDNR